MQTFILTRGHEMWVDFFIRQLQGKYLPFNFEGKNMWLELSVRPIQLWELAYPKEHHDTIMNTIFGNDFSAGVNGIPGCENKLKIGAWGMRKALGAKPFKEWKTDNVLPLSRKYISVLGIGTREDKDQPFGEGV